MRSRSLHTQSEFEEFGEAYERASQHSAPRAYIARSHVRGFFDDSGRLVGGYVLNNTAPFRYLDTTPDECSLPPDVQANLQELTLLWKAREVGAFGTIRIYTAVVLDMFRRRGRHVIFGTTAKALLPIFEHAASRVLYHGPTLFAANSSPAWIFIGTRWTFARGVWMTFTARIRNALGRRRPVRTATTTSHF